MTNDAQKMMINGSMTTAAFPIKFFALLAVLPERDYFHSNNTTVTTMMRLPVQAKPVKRPDLIQPHTAVDVKHGEGNDLLNMLSRLTHGANFNDPPAFRMPDYQRMKQSCYSCGWLQERGNP